MEFPVQVGDAQESGSRKMTEELIDEKAEGVAAAWSGTMMQNYCGR